VDASGGSECSGREAAWPADWSGTTVLPARLGEPAANDGPAERVDPATAAADAMTTTDMATLTTRLVIAPHLPVLV
jgi:hypothetical protein